jgi:hypothetical protein
MPYPRVLVITSCTGEKRFKPSNQLTLEDFKDPEQLGKREAELTEFACPAGQMYTGMQHLRLMEGVQLLRQTLSEKVVDVVILSAGYGLISEDRSIAPYEVTFNIMRGMRWMRWAQFLGVHQAFEKAIQDYDLIFLLLGDNYLRSLSLPIKTHPEQTLVVLASQESAKLIKGLAAKTFVLPLTNLDCPAVLLWVSWAERLLVQAVRQTLSKDQRWLQRLYQTPELFTETLVTRVPNSNYHCPKLSRNPSQPKL